MLYVVMLHVVMLYVVMLYVVMLLCCYVVMMYDVRCFVKRVDIRVSVVGMCDTGVIVGYGRRR